MASTDLIIKEAFPINDERLYPSEWRSFEIPIISLWNWEIDTTIISLNNMKAPVEADIIGINDITDEFVVTIKAWNHIELSIEIISLNNMEAAFEVDIIALNLIADDQSVDIIAINDILGYVPIEAEIIALNRLEGAPTLTNAAHTITVKIDDVDVTDEVISWQITISDSAFVNHATINFASNNYFTLCYPMTRFGEERLIITIDDIEYTFMIEKRPNTASHNDMGFSIWGRTLIATLDMPFVMPIIDKRVVQNPDTGVWSCPDDSSYIPHIWQTSDRLASDIIEAVIGDSFNLVMEIDDFLVKKDTFIVSNETPITIVNRLARVVGAHVRTNLDNDVIVRYYVHSTTGTAVSTYTDLENLLLANESFQLPSGYNKVLVRGPRDALSEQGTSLNIVLDEELNEGKSQFLFGEDIWFRIYASPFTTTISVTSSIGTIYTVSVDVSETITQEQTAFSGNSLGTTYPIYTINSIEKYDCTTMDSSEYEFTQGYKNVISETGTEDEPVQITYTTKYSLYKLVVDQPCDPLVHSEVISRIVAEQTS